MKLPKNYQKLDETEIEYDGGGMSAGDIVTIIVCAAGIVTLGGFGIAKWRSSAAANQAVVNEAVTDEASNELAMAMRRSENNIAYADITYKVNRMGFKRPIPGHRPARFKPLTTGLESILEE